VEIYHRLCYHIFRQQSQRRIPTRVGNGGTVTLGVNEAVRASRVALDPNPTANPVGDREWRCSGARKSTNRTKKFDLRASELLLWSLRQPPGPLCVLQSCSYRAQAAWIGSHHASTSCCGAPRKGSPLAFSTDLVDARSTCPSRWEHSGLRLACRPRAYARERRNRLGIHVRTSR
jgi:hypothetical protein